MHAEELVLGDGVPSTFIRSSQTAPLVIFSNGYAAPRSEAVPPGVPENQTSPPLVVGLLLAGYNVLVPENAGHGERLDTGDSTTAALTRSFAGDGPDLVRRTIDETAGIVDGAVNYGLVSSAKNIAVVGHSWGAFQSVLRLVGDERIAGGVGLIPVIDPRCLHPFKSLASGSRLDAKPLVKRAIEGIRSRPLLLIASSDDDVAPAETVREFVRSLRASSTGSAVEYLELDDVGHHYAPAQLAATLVWLHANLPTDAHRSLSREHVTEHDGQRPFDELSSRAGTQ